MDWELLVAKNGELTLLLNGKLIYSKYNPCDDAKRWVKSEVNYNKEGYVLIGLGLGYHAYALAQLISDKPIYVYYFDPYECEIAVDKLVDIPNCRFVSTLDEIEFDETIQLLIPNVWIKALGESHSLFPYLEDIKINQISYKKYSALMEENFYENIKGQWFIKYPSYPKGKACLVASGPSLNETIDWLRIVKDEVFILCVGSALKLLLSKGIQPNAVVISDPKESIKKQLENTSYSGDLFYLSTANYEAVQTHQGNRYIVYQYGYPLAEIKSKEVCYPLVETGGSVATVALSLLEILGFQQVILFGQDLGFYGERTHAEYSTSGREISGGFSRHRVISNSGDYIYTSPNLLTYLRWFNKKIKRTNMSVYNTAFHGAKIEGVPYINQEQLNGMIGNKESL